MRAIALLLVLAAPPASAAWPELDGARALYLSTIQKEAALHGVPPALADAVAMVETGYRADAVGSSGEIGLMQVMPATARQLGYAGTLAGLFDPATNISLGVDYLGRAWQASGGDICRALMKYRAGLAQDYMTPLSQSYCARAMAWLVSTGGTLAQAALPPDAQAALPPDAQAALPPDTQAGLPPDADAAPDSPPWGDPHVVAIGPALAAQTSPRALLVSGPAGPLTPTAFRARPPAGLAARLATARLATARLHPDPYVHRMPKDVAARAAAAITTALNDE